jgi:hypothetical protein
MDVAPSAQWTAALKAARACTPEPAWHTDWQPQYISHGG